MKPTPILLFAALAVLLLSACAPPFAEPELHSPEPPLSAGEVVQDQLSQRLGVPVQDVQIVDVEQAEWSDSCLGLGQPHESCLMAITPGYRVTVHAAGETYVFRTDQDASSVRLESSGASEAAVAAAIEKLSRQLDLSPAQIELVLVEEAEWPDPCLGLPEPDELCAMVITPGYLVELQSGGQSYRFRTDLEGSTVRQERSEPAQAAIDAAKELLAEELELEIDPAQIDLMLVEEAEWPNACLGLPEEDEMCAEVLVSGYRIELMVSEQIHVIRTDQEGRLARLEAQTPSPAAEAAVQALAEQLGFDPTRIDQLTVEQAEWTDSCLGLGQPNEGCLMVITPGYRIVVRVDGQTYAARTNQDGSVVRLEGPHLSRELAPRLETGAPVSVEKAARQALSQQTGTPAAEIVMVEAIQVDWRDGCLEAGGPNVMCTMAIVPGYRLIMDAAGESYEVRTDRAGNQVVVVGTAGKHLQP
jgi:hypothetical protein